MVLNPDAAMPVEELLAACGIEENEENIDQLAVFLTALKLFDDRNRTYRNIWETYGALSNLLRAATKVDREMEIWWHQGLENPLLHKEALDDAFDAINYLVFFIRCVRSGNITGSKRARPVVADEVSYNERQMILAEQDMD